MQWHSKQSPRVPRLGMCNRDAHRVYDAVERSHGCRDSRCAHARAQETQHVESELFPRLIIQVVIIVRPVCLYQNQNTASIRSIYQFAYCDYRTTPYHKLSSAEDSI